MLRRPRHLIALALLAAAWCSAGLHPLREVLEEAGAPADFTRDYVTAHAFVHHVPSIEGEAANDYAVAIGAHRVVLLGAPYHFHPPPALLLILPLVPLGYHGAALAWLALSLGLLGWLAFSLVAIIHRDDRPPALHVAGMFALLALWPPVLHNLAKGQWSIALAALIAGGWRALEGGRLRTAGVWLGFAACLKATPVLLLGYLALRHRRAAAAMVATVGALFLTSLTVEGGSAWRGWFATGPVEVAAWQTWTANTTSLNGLFARILVGGAFFRPMAFAPALAAGLTLAISVLLIGGVAFATWRAHGGVDGCRRFFAAWCALVVLLNPIGWSHTLVIALCAVALLVGLVPHAALVAAMIAFSIPREALSVIAGLVTAPLFASLLLFVHGAAALVLAFSAVRAAVTAPAGGEQKIRTRRIP